MQLPRSRAADAGLLSTLLFPAIIAAITLDCGNIRADKHTFDLSTLGGPRSVMDSIPSKDVPENLVNTTFTIDICQPLKVADSTEKGNACPSGTRVCGIERLVFPNENKPQILKTIPIAGEYIHDGGHLEPIPTRLSTSKSNEDSKKEGLRLELHGGVYNGRKQEAIIEFICDKNRTGLEDDSNSEDDKKTTTRSLNTSAMGNGTSCMSSLKFIKYETDKGDVDTLRLQWDTKFACENADDDVEAPVKAGWGFFTWFILIAFLSTAAYLIFGSWLNYNRYGARGWDLLPHGDTIRDVPYLMKDWSRRVLSTVQGSGSRGGYAAV